MLSLSLILLSCASNKTATLVKVLLIEANWNAELMFSESFEFRFAYPNALEYKITPFCATKTAPLNPWTLAFFLNRVSSANAFSLAWIVFLILVSCSVVSLFFEKQSVNCCGVCLTLSEQLCKANSRQTAIKSKKICWVLDFTVKKFDFAKKAKPSTRST